MKRIRKFVLSLAMLLFLVSPVLAQSPVKIYFMGPDGHEKLVSATDPLPVISVFSSLPLPLGASTEATLQLILNELTDPDSKAYITNWPLTYNIGNWPSGFNVNNWPSTIMDNAHGDSILTALSNLQTQVNKLSALDDATLSDSTMVDTTLPDTVTIVAVPIPARCVGYSFSTENGTKFKWSKVSNMATYTTVQAGYPTNSYQEKGVFYAGTLYFKDSTSADTINVQFVIKP